MSDTTRRGVLARLLGVFGAALTARPALATVSGEAHPRPDVVLHCTHVAGMPHYDGEAVAEGLTGGEALVLRREPGNPHDPRAIEVYAEDGRKLGYVPRHRNEPIANLMDAGVPASGRVVSVGRWGRRVDVRFEVVVALG